MSRIIESLPERLKISKGESDWSRLGTPCCGLDVPSSTRKEKILFTGASFCERPVLAKGN